MKIFNIILILLFSTTIQANDWLYNTAAVHSCTPWQETGKLYGVNKVFGEPSIEITIQSDRIKLIVNKLEMRQVSNGIYEAEKTRVMLDISTLGWRIENFKIITENKTTWFNCTLIGRYYKAKNGNVYRDIY